MADSSLM